MLIPGSIAGLTRDFLSTAANAHQGKGATATLRVGSKGSPRAVVEAEGEFVALDNALIRMAVSMVNERLLPTPALIAEVERIAAGGHAAFMHDLSDYEAER